VKTEDGSVSERPILSIAVPCHRRDALLERALASCQPLAARPDVEVVVSWNPADGQGLGELRDRHPAFRWCGPPQPLPLGANWDYCLGQATGEWCLVLSYDDQLLPDRLAAVLPRLRECDETVACVFGVSAIEDVSGAQPRLIAPARRAKPELWPPPELWRHIAWGAPVHLPAAIFRRAVWRRAGGFDNGFAFACDTGLWERISREYAVWRVPDCWSIYRWHAYSPASARAAHADALKLAAAFRGQLGRCDVFGRLACWFGFLRQQCLAAQLNADYQAERVQTLSRGERLVWKMINGLEHAKIAGLPLTRVVFRILLGLWKLTGHIIPGSSRRPAPA
jgi:glycosyltransferase involved in cell wall biosynthesis